ncbi:MAG: DUF2339 domain-containing protein [Thermodesulfovibrionales bacterium]
MKCPGCKKTITDSSERCNSCGYVLPEDIRTKLSVYYDLRQELETLRSTFKTTVWPGIQKISVKIDLLEKALADDLQMLAVSEEEIEPEPKLQETTSGPLEEKVSEPEADEVKDIPLVQDRVFYEKVSAPLLKEKKDGSGFEIRLGQKWLLIVGIVTMVFGIGYFLKYSFDRGWIGPVGRVTMAYLWGLVLLTGGNGFRKRFETFGLYVIGGGLATLYFSTFAGFQIYHLFGQIPSFSIMTMITVLACVLSVIHDTKWLAVLGLVGGFFTPVMLSTGQDNQIALMTYISILNLGLLGIAFYKRWDLLNYLGFAFTYMLFTEWFGSYYQDSKFWPSIIFLNIFYLTYSIIPFAYRSLRKDGTSKGSFLITALNSFIAFALGYYMIRRNFPLEWVSVITIPYALVSILMAAYIYKRREEDEDTFVMLSAKAALFLVITVPIIFSKHWITIFWSAQAITLLWAGLRLERKQLLIGSYLLLGLSVGKFLMYDYPVVFGFSPATLSISGSFTYLLPERLITAGFVLLIIQRFSAMLSRFYGDPFSVFGKDDSRLFSALFGTLLFICLTVETSSFFHDYYPYTQPAALCILWAVYSFVLLLLGHESEDKGLCVTAYLLFAVSAGKFLLHDYTAVYHFSITNWAMPGSYSDLLFERALTAALLLSLLQISSLLLKKKAIDILSSSLNVRSEYILHDALFGLLLFIILNIETSSFFHEYLPSARFAAISVLWSLFSVALMIQGFTGKSPLVRKISLALFLLTLIKVFLFDMANVGTPYRIVSFIILGILLVCASYLYHRFKDRILGNV